VNHGLGRHPGHADGFDTLARIHSDKGELAEARVAWEKALSIVPEHGGALKGISFLYFRQGDTKRAVDALEHALAANPDDDAAQRALAALRVVAWPEAPAAAAAESPRKRPSEVPQLRATASALQAMQSAPPAPGSGAGAPPTATPPPPPAAATKAPLRPPVFAGLEGATADMLLLDAHGLVMAGGLKSADGGDVSELAAAALAGVSGEASRTADYLRLGTWTVIVAEAEQANVVLSPVGESALVMLRRDKSTAVGLALRIGDRAKRAALKWLEEQAP
jgi:predicted regulator of Ras-like GTPase activity (Roadblock/LC7/MglB family)